MVLLKQLPEDFAVEEVYGKNPAGSAGEYAYFWLRKRDFSTLDAVRRVADYFRVSKGSVGFAGVKDKRAVTTQLISVKTCAGSFPDWISIGDSISLAYSGRGSRPMSLGMHDGNKFTIVLRGLSSEESHNMELACKNLRASPTVPNYFDEQRFSSRNVAIGRAIVLGDARGAVEAILNSNETAKGSYEAAVKQTLNNSPNDYGAALKAVQFTLRRLFIHAYQALLFNRAVSSYLRAVLPQDELAEVKYSIGSFVFPQRAIGNIAVPVIGFGTDIAAVKYKSLAGIIRLMLAEEGITPRSFIIRNDPELSAEGGTREMMMSVRDFDWRIGDDDCTLSFSLAKGCYATVVVKSLVQPM